MLGLWVSATAAATAGEPATIATAAITTAASDVAVEDDDKASTNG